MKDERPWMVMFFEADLLLFRKHMDHLLCSTCVTAKNCSLENVTLISGCFYVLTSSIDTNIICSALSHFGIHTKYITSSSFSPLSSWFTEPSSLSYSSNTSLINSSFNMSYEILVVEDSSSSVVPLIELNTKMLPLELVLSIVNLPLCTSTHALSVAKNGLPNNRNFLVSFLINDDKIL